MPADPENSFPAFWPITTLALKPVLFVEPLDNFLHDLLSVRLSNQPTEERDIEKDRAQRG